MGNTVVVLGAGASGYVAAIQAAKAGARVLLLDKQEKTARKVVASGNGRCNLSNRHIGISCYQTHDPTLLQGFLSQSAQVVSFWRDAGLLIRSDEEGRLYPWCNRAQTVADALFVQARAVGVEHLCREVRSLRQTDAGWLIETDQDPIETDSVVIALGSVAAPSLGATDTGLALAASLGISYVPFSPSLVPLRTAPRYPAVKGSRQFATVTLTGESVHSEQGEVLFTDYGLSGIAVMQLSAFAAKGDVISVDLVPQLSMDALKKTLYARIQSGIYPTVDKLLVGLFDKPLSYTILKVAGITPLDLPVGEVNSKQVDNLAGVLKGWRFIIAETLGYDYAQVAQGGVLLSELDGNLQAKKAPGLYFCGEVVDVTGLCGGYNLHWAWLSGLIAGRHAGARMYNNS